MHPAWWTGVAVAAVAVFLRIAWPAWRRRRLARSLALARREFQLRREWLEAEFVKAVTTSGRPRGLAWDTCDFEDQAYFAIDRQTGQLRAFVAVSITFEAIEGEGMEDNPNVANLRAATAVFRYDGRRWHAEERALFNLTPQEAAERFGHDLQGDEPAHADRPSA